MPHLMGQQDRQQSQGKRQSVHQGNRIVPHAHVTAKVGIEIEGTAFGETAGQAGSDHGGRHQR